MLQVAAGCRLLSWMLTVEWVLPQLRGGRSEAVTAQALEQLSDAVQ